ncbi:radical SAM family heme chaperone HemW [Salibacterium qingdaonense]|uniref:Heme chaperone HemW n=1 Tax=Salibacterium qingdaonense TaxID=266892 RepID=A0A1I4JHB9_9BACI|nr:radical SAM family heme chaperone HemW [Salibacterium qingdaonense]SFL65960.1 oxygen-independent coproporphyrinogen-3 oxidase [Salibacterium qingdaonense]
MMNVQEKAPASPASIYVHIPFCRYICFYCDFNKFFIENQPVDDYIEQLDREMKRVLMEPAPVDTVYVGGGTPTALGTDQLRRVLRDVKKRTDSSRPLREFSVEVNPGEADWAKFDMMKEEGVTRLSIGIQTFNDSLLQKIGRGHSAAEAKETVLLARESGFDNISIDLMFGLPEQTMADWKDTITRALQLDIDHVSAYSLKIEEKTMFYNWYRQGKIKPLPEDTEADMYEVLEEALADAGFHAYEISNFAKPGKESEHNKTYWRNEEYYGFGAGAHGYLNGVRYANLGPLPHYLKAVKAGENPVKDTHEVSRTENMEEEMFMGLRMKEGVSAHRFYRKFNCSYYDIYPEALQELTEEGLLYDSGSALQLTEKGRLLGNEVFARFLLDEEG